MPMTCCRSGVGLARPHNYEVIVEHWFDGASYLKSVEWLDKGANEWKLAGSMSYVWCRSCLDKLIYQPVNFNQSPIHIILTSTYYLAHTVCVLLSTMSAPV